MAIHRSQRNPAPVVQFCGVLLAVLGFAAVEAGVQPVVRRGLFVRSDVIKTDHEYGLACELAASADSTPRVLLTKLDHQTVHEASVYQKLLDRKPDETDRSRKNYEILGEMQGDETVRKATVVVGPCANETFDLNGQAVRTDAQGIVTDEREQILRAFDADDLGKTRTTLQFRHPQLGEATLEVSRNQLLEAFGMAHMYAEKNAPLRWWSNRDGLKVKATWPQTVAPGETVTVSVEISNAGDKHSGEICGRTVSRHAWLNGRNFYFGILAPGETRSFSRVLTVPADAIVGEVFGALGLYDHILRAMPEKTVQIRLSVAVPKPK